MADGASSPARLQVVGMVQLRPLPGSARYAGEPLSSIVEAALAEVAVLSECGFTGVQLQNMGDNPSTRRAGLETIAYMTTAAVEIRRSHPRLQLSILVNWDAEASIAVAEASGADYVRVEHTWIGASITSWGISQAQCHEATAFRTRIRSRMPIFADVYEPHAVPLVDRPVEVLARAAVDEGGADGLFVTGNSFDQSMAWGTSIREVLPTVPLWLGGGATVENIGTARSVFDGVTVATSIKHGDMRNAVDPQLAKSFLRAALGEPRT